MIVVPKSTKSYLLEKPLYTCKPFLIIVITKSFLRITKLGKTSKMKIFDTKIDICLPNNAYWSDML